MMNLLVLQLSNLWQTLLRLTCWFLTGVAFDHSFCVEERSPLDIFCWPEHRSKKG